MAAMNSSDDHVERNRRFWDESAAGWHGPLARGHWSRPAPVWGLWETPESQAEVFGALALILLWGGWSARRVVAGVRSLVL